MSSVSQPLNIAVLTISDTRTLETDKSGDYLHNALSQEGHVLEDRALVKDDIYQQRAIVSQWIANKNIQVILITGGTGFTHRDSTPEAISAALPRLRERTAVPIGGYANSFGVPPEDGGPRPLREELTPEAYAATAFCRQLGYAEGAQYHAGGGMGGVLVFFFAGPAGAGP